MDNSPRSNVLNLIFSVVLSQIVFVCHGTKTFNITSLLSSKLKDAGIDSFQPGKENVIPDGFCKTWIGTVVAENSTWEEPHCRTCRCDAISGAVCEEPVCEISFHPYLETNCEQWSTDGCCCLRSTCVHDGVRYSAHEVFLLNPEDPCIVCECDPSDGLPRCLEASCPELCVDGIRVPGKCCPICPSGSNCGQTSVPLGEGFQVDDVTPIPENASRLVTLTSDPLQTWNCTCINPGGPADCLLLEN